MRVKIITIICLLSIAGISSAQERSMPGRILFRIKPEAVAAFRSAFANPEINERTFDPQKFSLRDTKAIAVLLELPSSFPVTSLKPFIPQHNVVLEALRERTNPTIFQNLNSNGIAPKETDEIRQLRATEEKLSRWFEVFFDTSIANEKAIFYLQKSKIVEVAEPRYKYTLSFTPNDPFYSQQYSLPLIHAPQAWDIVKCDSTMIVADDDIGADWTHPDLANAVFVNSGETGLDSLGFDKRSNGIDDDGDGFIDDWHGWDFAGSDGTEPDNDPNTLAQHGTHTSGIMAASGNNNVGICGVAFGAKLLILKCASDAGQDVSFGYDGIVFAADHGAKVVNNSWGGTNRTQSGQDIVNYAVSKNCVVVAAAGNGGDQESVDGVLEGLYPAQYDHVLSVDAIDATGTITSFSNFNTSVSVSAPGNDVLSTVPGDQYSNMSGTSMAAPTAAGAIALVRQKYPTISPDQAIQLLRATSDSLNSSQDRHPGFTGKGKINIYRAVTQNPVFSARLESVQIFNQQNDGSLHSGEAGTLVFNVRNYLAALSNLSATVDILNDTGHFLSKNTNTVPFGKANTLSLVQNFQGSFAIQVSPYTPTNYSVLIRLTYYSTPDGYGPDVDYYTLIINKGYLDLNKNNLTVTLDAKANIGYDDPPNNTEGDGFVWTKPPSSIQESGTNVLFSAGLMFASDDQHIAAAAPSPGSDVVQEQDFSSVQAIRVVSPPDHSNAAQELFTVYSDEQEYSGNQPGVTVTQKAYGFTKDLSANAVVIDYMIHQRADSVAGIAAAAALFMDWDIGSNGSLNQAYTSSLDPAIAITRRMEDKYPFVGIKLISTIPVGAARNFYALDNDGSNGSARTYGGLSMGDKWMTMNTPRAQSSIGDVSMIYGLRNLDMTKNDSVQMTYVIAMAENEGLIKQTIDQTTNEWFGVNAVPTAITENAVSVFPNPFGSKLNIRWQNDYHSSATVTISDELGREMLHRATGSNTLELADLHLASGNYILTIRMGMMIYHQMIVCMP
jgi:hypothetical protein